MSLREDIIKVLAEQDRLAPTDREVHEAMADALLPLVVAREVADELATVLGFCSASTPETDRRKFAAIASYNEALGGIANLYGTTASGKPITDELVEELAAKAEAGYPVCTCGAGNSGWMNHSRECPVRVDAENVRIEERARRHLESKD